jgi:predicted HTH domain antitoxin
MDLVAAGIYQTQEEVIIDALRHLLLAHPEYRVTMAVHQYQTSKEISLGFAAQLAGVSQEEMKEILHDRGIALRLGPENIQEAVEEITTLRKHLDESHSE